MYTIQRSSEKYIKRLKGEETLEAKTDLNFEVYDQVTDETTSLNGTSRNQTDANIRKHFGTVEDFSVSSLASQHGALSFVDEGSTRRKEIIAKFLDLEIFDKKFKLSKEDSIETKVLLKKNENREFDTEIEEVKEELIKAKKNSKTNQDLCTALKTKVEKTKTMLKTVEEQIDSSPSEFINIGLAVKNRKEKGNLFSALSEKILEQNNRIVVKQEKLHKTIEFLTSLDIDSLHTDKEVANSVEANIENLQKELEEIDKKRQLLESIPCGDSFPTCRFIRDAHISVATHEVAEHEHKTAIANLEAMEIEKVDKQILQYDNVENLSQKLEKEIAALQLMCERNKNTQTNLEFELKEIQGKIEEYNDNKDVIENLEKLLKQKETYEKNIQLAQVEIQNCEKKTLGLYKQIGSEEQKLESIREQQRSHLRLRREFAAHDLFMRCMHANGIAYDVIKKKIPVINQEIAKVLANIVDFEIFFESSGNKFDIFIKHPEYDERPIEMASGAEKTMGAMAIRLALLSVSSLPKSDLFILDEPGTALDEENMEGFIRILELIKVYFKNVLLISHLDSLKDCVDMQVVIEKNKGYARVNQ